MTELILTFKAIHLLHYLSRMRISDALSALSRKIKRCFPKIDFLHLHMRKGHLSQCLAVFSGCFNEPFPLSY